MGKSQVLLWMLWLYDILYGMIHNRKKDRINGIRDSYWMWDTKEVPDEEISNVSNIIKKTDKEADALVRKYHTGSYFDKVRIRLRMDVSRSLYEKLLFVLTGRTLSKDN